VKITVKVNTESAVKISQERGKSEYDVWANAGTCLQKGLGIWYVAHTLLQTYKRKEGVSHPGLYCTRIYHTC